MSATEFITKAAGGINLPPYWKLAVIRCALYAGVSGGNTWLAGTEGYSAWTDISPLAKDKLCVNVALAVASIWISFFDQTLTGMGAKPLTPDTVKQMIADMTSTTVNQTKIP